MKRRAIKQENGTVKLQRKCMFWWRTDGYLRGDAYEMAEKSNWFDRNKIEKINF